MSGYEYHICPECGEVCGKGYDGDIDDVECNCRRSKNMKMKNRKDLSIWMNPKMKVGYSFVYTKGIVNGQRINIGVTCVDTGEYFAFKWEQTHEED